MDDVVLVAVDDGETRVGGLDHEGDELLRRLADVDHVHLRARDHDLANRPFGHLQHALHHGQRVGVEQVVFVGGVQQADELLAIFGFAQQQCGKAF
jgi:hypothetical protein